MFAPDLPSHAEIAATVSDEYQGIGIGPLLIRHLARIAHANGVTQFEADVMGDNQRMLAMLRNSGCVIHQANNAGVVHFTLDCPECAGHSLSFSESNYADPKSDSPEGGSHA